MNSARWIAAVGFLLIIGSRSVADEPKKLLLLGQKPDGHPPGTHEYMPGQRLLAKLLANVNGIESHVVQADDPWRDGPKLLDEADGVVLFVSEGAKWVGADAERLRGFERLGERGGGLVVLHWGMGTREPGPIHRFVKLFGGCHGGPDRTFKVIDDAEVRVANRDHPITRGVGDLRVRDEFYYQLKFVQPAGAIRPVLQVPIDGELETVAWSWDRPDGGRSFGFSGLHFHENWERPEYRRLVVQAVLWTLKLPIPKQGIPVVITSNDLDLTADQDSPADFARATERYASHPPVRPLPTPITEPLANGPKMFVDSKRGDDDNAGTEKAPWRTLANALRRLKPGDTLYLRGGVYYEKVPISKSGTAEAPITIASYPCEIAVIDGGLREFLEAPATSWEPFPSGADGEFVSTKSYWTADSRKVPQQFLPASWEPMWGIEDERPIALGHFADSMVPLHGYRIAADLRATNELWLGGKNAMRDTGVYCGPGLWFNRDTGRIHLRLAQQKLDGMGERAYRGETDPRKLPLVIAVGFGDEVMRVTGVKHVRVRGLVFRGATGSPMIHVYGSENVELDHVTVFGGFPGLLVNASKNIRVTNSAFRGLAAPWSSRASMKYRGTPSYQIVLRNDQPLNENIEFAWCEFTDDHDFAFLRDVKNLQFHHNFVDNFNDDGLECGPKLRDHTVFIYQNRIGPCLIPLTQHEFTKDDSPLDHAPGSGVYIFRNVFDMRGGTHRGPPTQPDPTGLLPPRRRPPGQRPRRPHLARVPLLPQHRAAQHAGVPRLLSDGSRRPGPATQRTRCIQ